MRWLLGLLLIAAALTPQRAATAVDEPVPVEVWADTNPFTMSAVGGLADNPLLRIAAKAFAADTTGTIRQCDIALGRCDNELPVRFDQHGEADVLYLVRAEFCGTQRCLVEVRDGQDSGFVETVLGARATPTLTLRVDPANNVRAGQSLALRIPELALDARSDVQARLCPASLDRIARCAPLAAVTAGDANAALTPGDVARCQADGCLVALFAGDQPLRSNTVLLGVVRGGAVDYDRRRVAAGGGAALLLVALAAMLVRYTDWRPRLQAETAALDDVPYADLDAEAASFVDR